MHADMPVALMAQDIGPLLDSCTELRNLNLSSCRSLRPDALQALMNPVQIPLADKLEPASSVSPQVCRAPQLSADDRLPTTYSLQWPPLLHSLDVSYCPLPAQELDIVLQKADSLQVRMILAARPCMDVPKGVPCGRRPCHMHMYLICAIEHWLHHDDHYTSKILIMSTLVALSIVDPVSAAMVGQNRAMILAGLCTRQLHANSCMNLVIS